MVLQRNLLDRSENAYSDPVSDLEYYGQLDSIVKAGETCILSFILCFSEKTDNEIYLEFSDYRLLNMIPDISGTAKTGASLLFKNCRNFALQEFIFQENVTVEEAVYILKQFINFPIYEISPKEMRFPYGTTGDKFLKKDGSNIVSFLDYLKDNQEDIYTGLKKSLYLITKDFQGFRLEVTKNYSDEIKGRFSGDTIKRFGLIDNKDKSNTIWAEHLSDGILYFLAFLCAVNQPYPPPVLLIEEPEKGIHPRRIQEVMDLLFALSEERNVQVIVTTHSTFVLDQFSDIPENVSVFENHNSIITVRNLKNDIIAELDSNFEKQGYSKEDFTNSLGENWALGLLGGIPD